METDTNIPGVATGEPVQQQAQTVAAPDINNAVMQDGELPSLVDLGREPSSGAWPEGWYKARIIEGYATGSGYQWETIDKPSKDGESRNMTICFELVDAAGEKRNIWKSLNYRLGDFDPRKIAALPELRKQYGNKSWGPKGSGEADLQRTSIAIGQLGQFERALGFKLKMAGGGLLVAPFFNQQMDVHVVINDETGYNEVTEFAKLGEKTTPKARK